MSPDRKVNATTVAAKSEPGFGLALPGNKPPETGLLPKLPPGPTPTVPALDLPSMHGDAKSIADATTPKLATETPQTPSIPTSKPGRSYENAKQVAMDQIESGDLKKALATLSVFYNAQELTNSQRVDMVDMLDALAREVIYSRRHLMDFAYVVAPGESLEQISKRYNVPAEVLARINGLDMAFDTPAGTKLKIVPGPFRAEVNLSRNELTLFAGDLYAGRYPASFGTEPQPNPGEYQVLDKQRDRNYYSSNGMQISTTDPANPYGGYWIDLGQDVCIHGSAEAEGGPSHLGCISLSPLDANDVFGMLGRGSQVTIRR
jgi:lipoprotein-anchoring transpeptidase ErfK/SrfK